MGEHYPRFLWSAYTTDAINVLILVMAKRKVGRPTNYTKKLADTICERIVTGESVRSIVDDPKMPAMATFFRWLRDRQEFREQYEEAKQLQADLLADEIMDIADDGRNDWMEANAEDNPGYRMNGEHVQRSKLRVDARKWVAARLLPKRYGDKYDVTSEGKALKGNTIIFSDFDEADSK